MPWRPLPRIAFAVAIFPFQATNPADLPLELGDELYIIEQGGADGSWYRGYLVAPPSLLAGLTSVKGQPLEARVYDGIFPKANVEIRELLGDARFGDTEHGPDEENASLAYKHANGDYQDHTGSLESQNNHLNRSGSKRDSARAKVSLINGKRNISASHPISGNSSLTGGPAPARSLSHRSVTSRQSSRLTQPMQSFGMNLVKPRDPEFPKPPAPVPMLKIGDETPTSVSEPLVDEIASCLREWHSTNLHELLLARQYAVLERVSTFVHRLDLSRRQLLHGVLTGQELSDVRERTIWDLVMANRMLSNEVIVRDLEHRGRLLNGDDSVVQMTKLQSMMSLLDKPPIVQNDTVKLNHLLVGVEEPGPIEASSPTLTIYLCSGSQGETLRPLTEPFSINLEPQEQVNNSIDTERFRTLFTELTPYDVGDVAGSTSQLHLVVRLQMYQYTKVSSIATSAYLQGTVEENTSPKVSSVGNSVRSTMRGGRQSLVWAQRQIGSSYRSRMQSGSKLGRQPAISGSVASITSTERPQTAVSQRPPTREEPQAVNRTVGIGVLNISHIMAQNKKMDQTVSIWSPDENGTAINASKDTCNELIRKLITSQSGRFSKCKALEQIRLQLQPFACPEATVLINSTPTLLQNVTETPRIGFSGVPTKPRSDIYITISEAFLPPQALLSHPERGTVELNSELGLRDMQLTLEVRKATGERIENCIYPSSNSNGFTAWRTTAVERSQAWNETIRLNIHDEDVPHAHLIMSIADAGGFPFALSWTPLWEQNAFLCDGQHAPLLYLYDQVTSYTESSGKGAYLSFPWNSKADDDLTKDETLTSLTATLQIHTYLCSTTFSQDPVLLGVLRWREKSAGQLLELLERLMFVSEIEIVKMISDVFDALFGILVDHAGQDEFEDHVFNDIITVLSIVHDRRFNLGPLVDDYLENRFDCPFAAPCLIRSYLRLLSDPAEPAKSRKLRSTVKVGRHVLKFVMYARANEDTEEANFGTDTKSIFNRDIRNIFKALEAVMNDTSPVLVGTKTLVVQHFYTWLPELKKAFAESEILNLATGFLDACENVQGKLVVHKLLLILNISGQKLFTENSTRRQLISNIIRWLDPYWGSTHVVTDQWQEQLRICCSVVAVLFEDPNPALSGFFPKIVQSYQTIQKLKPHVRTNLSIPFPTVYPFPAKSIESGPKFNEALMELAALGSLFSTHCSYAQLDFDSLNFANILEAALDVSTSVLDGEAFPHSWLSLNLYHHRSILRELEHIFAALSNNFLPPPEDADSFKTDLWKSFFTTLLKLVRSDSLTLETFAEQKRRAVWKIAGDVREQGARLLHRSWAAIGWETNLEDRRRYGLDRMGGFQVQYVPGLVGPIVELCLSVHEGLRKVAVGILQAMIVSEWTLSEDLSIIQAEIIESLDIMFKSREVRENMYQKLFVGELLELFDHLARVPDDPLWQALKELIATVDELLGLLFAANSTDMAESFRIMHTLRLMDFLRDVNKEDIYLRYVHKLASTQSQTGNSTEAGLALRLHADLYNWESSMKARAMSDPPFPEQSCFERKEQLYFQMIDHFESGKSWESALSCYQELAVQYEHYCFDFAKLARTQSSIAKIYEAIAKGARQNPRYFRVGYRGLGFPNSLRDKQFIFEGASTEKLSAFTDRIRQQHPSAQVTSSGDAEGLEGQFLEISPVSVHRDLAHPLYQRPRVSQPIRDYVSSLHPINFANTSGRHSAGSNVKEQWIEKTIYTTEESFPTILRRSEVVNVQAVVLSPLETAIERTLRRTSELSSLQQRTSDGDVTAFPSFEDALNTAVDPASSSAAVHYRQLLPRQTHHSHDDTNYEETHVQPLENALKIALTDHALRIRSCITTLSRSPYSPQEADLLVKFQSTFAPELMELAPNRQQGFDDYINATDLPSFSPMLSKDQSRAKIPPVQNDDHTLSAPVPDAEPSDPTLHRSHSDTTSRFLSLSFLKRTNTNNTPSSLPQTNGFSKHEDHESSGHTTDRSKTASPRAKFENEVPLGLRAVQSDRTVLTAFNSQSPKDERQGSNGSRVDADDGSERPATAASSTSSAFGAGVRKRLSLLGIGRKGSSKLSINVDKVVEEE